MSNFKFTVNRILITRSGCYAEYTSPSGTTTLFPNFGFEKGDNIEIYDFDNYAPKKIIRNGSVIWTERDWKKWWSKYDPSGDNSQNPNRDAIVRQLMKSIQT